MQGWLFVNDEVFWQPAQAEALLTSVPPVSYSFYHLDIAFKLFFSFFQCIYHMLGE